MRSCIVANSRRGSQRVDGAIKSFRESWSPEGQEATPKILSDKRAFLLTSPICQATFFRLALGCPRRTLSICLCNAASIFLFASSKLLPRTVSDRSSQTPFQPSPSSQKLQSFGTLAETFSFTAWIVIAVLHSWTLSESYDEGHLSSTILF